MVVELEKSDLTSIGGIFSSLPMQFLVSPITVVASGILLGELAGTTGTLKSVWRNTYIFLGAVTMLLHTITFLTILGIGIRAMTPGHNFAEEITIRENHPITWGLIITSSIFTLVFGLFSLIGGFGRIFLSNPDEVITTGYSLMMIMMLHAAFIVFEAIRSGMRRPKPESSITFSGTSPFPPSKIFTPQPVAPVSTVVGNVNIPDISQFLTETASGPSTVSVAAPQPTYQAVPGMLPYGGIPYYMPPCIPTTCPQHTTTHLI